MDLPRRSLLGSAGAIAVALAGCTARRSSSAPSSEERTEFTTVRETTGTTRKTTVTELSGEPFSKFRIDATPSEVQLRHEATFISKATESTPARIRITISNPSSDAHTVRTANYGLPFPNPVSETTTDGTNLVLGDEYDDPADGCWEGHGEIEPMPETVEVNPDETIRGEYYVLNYAENESCWPPGEYRFEVGYALNPDDEAIEYRWGFDLVV